MNRRRALSLLTAFAAVMALTVGSGAFTAMEAERGVSIDVVDDDEAYVGYDTDNIDSDEEIDLVTITNRFNTNISIESIDATTNTAMSIEPVDPSTLESLDPGENVTLTGEVSNQVAGDTTVSVTVKVDGGSVWAAIYGDTATREFTVSGPEAPEDADEGVFFYGNGQIEIFSDSYSQVNTTIWTTEDPPNGNAITVQGEEVSNVTTGEKISKNQLQADKGETIIAITVYETGKTYARQGYDNSTQEFNNKGAGMGYEIDESSLPTE